MSVKKQIITISPPMFIEETGGKEQLTSLNHTCSRCGGNGWFWGLDGKDRLKINCPVCKGSGCLDAVVAIEWKASNNKNR